MAASATGWWMRLIADKSDLAALLAGGVHAGGRRGGEFLDRPIGVPGGVDHAFAAGDPGELMSRRSQRQLDLPGGIVAQAAGDDGAHLVAKPGEAAEVVEHAALAAPEEHVGVGRQLVPVGAELHLPLRTMVGEVAVDDAVLQHAAERQRKAARRPGELPGDHVVGADQHRRAECDRGHAARNAGG